MLMSLVGSEMCIRDRIYTVCMPHIHRFTVVDTVFIIIQILVKVNGAK